MGENDHDDSQGKGPPFPGYPGGRTYYLTVPLRPLTGDVPDEYLERLTLYYTTYGLVFGVIGLIAILLPLIFGVAVLPLLAWLLVLGGAITIMQFLLICGAPGTTSFLLLGVLHMAAGLFMLLQPHEASRLVTFLFAGWFLLHGVVKVLMSCQVQKLTTWPTVLVSGLVSVVLAVAALILTSTFGLTLLAIFFGADLIGTGFALILIAFMAFLGRGNRAVSDGDARNEPLLSGRGPPEAAASV